MRAVGIRSVLRNSSFLLGSHALTVLVRIVYIVMLARFLGPDAYGTLNYGMSWYLTLIALTYLGLDVVLAREIGRGHGSVAVLAGTTFGLRIGVAIAIAILSGIAALMAEPNPVARDLIVILSAALVGRAIWLWCVSVFTAYENTRYVLAIDFWFRPLEVLVVVLVLVLIQSVQMSILAVGIAHAAIWCVQGVVGVFTVLRRVTPIDFRISWHEVGSLLVAGIPGALYILAVAWFMQAPILLFRLLMGTGEDLGHFAVAIQVVGYLVVIPYLAASAALPVLSRSAARGDRKDRSAILAMLFLIPCGGAAIGSLGMMLATPLAVFALGPEYGGAGAVLSEAIWLLIPFSLAVGLQQVVFAHRRHITVVSFSGVLGGATMAVLFAPLTQTLSYRGALIAIGAGMLVWVGGLLISLVRSDLIGRKQ